MEPLDISSNWNTHRMFSDTDSECCDINDMADDDDDDDNQWEESQWPQTSKIRVVVKTLSGRKLPLFFISSSFVFEIKIAISEIEGIKPAEIQLTFNRKCLSCGRTLAESRITTNSTIFMIPSSL